ncbi:DNA-binding protein [Taibaiella sp. KBW10]|uniref:DUF3276 family protein n=1 Tax=Taibaiella sp. KBW10 TaxID=2153357 RepID=UPI000F5AA626|nr:DUF3276 family protein [Taibaiella sp. KBW10]RQO30436.1 DNA-binding protein [Taibaiella sp. KBW10]
MSYENNKNFDEKRNTEVAFSKKIKAGKRRTYFFDVRETRGSDYFITITESKKRFNDDGYDRHKMFLYKEDFNKFLAALTETIDFVKTDLMPDFDFDAFNHDDTEQQYVTEPYVAENQETVAVAVAAPVYSESENEINAELKDTTVDEWKM